METLGFIGSGTITEAIVRGLKASARHEQPVLLSPRNAEVSSRLSATFTGVKVGLDNQDVADRSGLLVLAVRPQIAETVLKGLRLGQNHRVISLIAGLDQQTIADWTGARSVCRAIPLPFVSSGRDTTPIYPPDPEGLSFFEALGGAIPISTLAEFNTFAALSALMGSYFGIAQTAADWGTRKGLQEAQARQYIARLFGNLADTLRDEPLRMEQLRDEHSTRGGLNEQAFRDFSNQGGTAALDAALDGVLARVTGG